MTDSISRPWIRSGVLDALSDTAPPSSSSAGQGRGSAHKLVQVVHVADACRLLEVSDSQHCVALLLTPRALRQLGGSLCALKYCIIKIESWHFSTVYHAAADQRLEDLRRVTSVPLVVHCDGAALFGEVGLGVAGDPSDVLADAQVLAGCQGRGPAALNALLVRRRFPGGLLPGPSGAALVVLDPPAGEGLGEEERRLLEAYQDAQQVGSLAALVAAPGQAAEQPSSGSTEFASQTEGSQRSPARECYTLVETQPAPSHQSRCTMEPDDDDTATVSQEESPVLGGAEGAVGSPPPKAARGVEPSSRVLRSGGSPHPHPRYEHPRHEQPRYGYEQQTQDALAFQEESEGSVQEEPLTQDAPPALSPPALSSPSPASPEEKSEEESPEEESAEAAQAAREARLARRAWACRRQGRLLASSPQEQAALEALMARYPSALPPPLRAAKPCHPCPPAAASRARPGGWVPPMKRGRLF